MCARDNEEELEDEFEVRVRRQRGLIEKGRREKGQRRDQRQPGNPDDQRCMRMTSC